jgi:glycosyltransferase involved in cell wall biosynthesis
MAGSSFLNVLKEKMRILYLTNKPIFPIVDGGCKAMHQFLKCLIQCDYTVEHICLSTHKHAFDLENYPKSILDKISTSSFEVDTRIKLLPALKSFFNRKSFVVSRFDNSAFHSTLEVLFSKEEFTHVILESLFTTPYIDAIRKYTDAKIIVRTHNVEHKIWKQLALNTNNPFKKFYFNRLSADLKKYEIEILKKADFIAAITEEDLSAFEELGIKTPKTVIPIAIDLSENHVDYSVSNLFFIGSMNWKPNIEAVDWLVNEILPAVKIVYPKIELHLAGSYMEKQFPTSGIKGIINHGFVSDSHKFMQNNGLLISPIRSGSGVRVKLLEAMALGVPVVTTKIGAVGIQHNNCVYLAETTAEFVSQIIELIKFQEKRMALGGKARKFIEDNNSVNSISNYLNDRISEL